MSIKFWFGILLAVAVLFCAALPFSPQSHAQQFGGTIYCSGAVKYDASTSGSTTLVASSSGTGGSIYICGYVISTASAVNVKLVYGTKVSTACDTGATAITPAYQFAATTAGIAEVIDESSNFRGLSVPAGNDLCINTSAGDSVQAMVYYYQQH